MNTPTLHFITANVVETDDWGVSMRLPTRVIKAEPTRRLSPAINSVNSVNYV